MSTETLTAGAPPAVQRYTLIQRLLHWIIAVLVLVLLAAGLTIGTLGYEGLVEAYGQDMTNTIYTYHKTLGVLVLALVVLRLALRLTLGKPSYASPLAPWQHTLSSIVHWLFYGLLIAMPVLGWLATAAGGYPVQFFDWNLPGLIGKDKALSEALFEWHGLLGLVLLGLIVLHVAAALTHWLKWNDGVMERMTLG
jgi:cytochrome b561